MAGVYGGFRAGPGLTPVMERDEVITNSQTSTASGASSAAQRKRTDKKLTVEDTWKIEKLYDDRSNITVKPSKLIPIAKWTATILVGAAILFLFITSRLSFLSMSLKLRELYKQENPNIKLTTSLYLVLVLALLVPTVLLLIRAMWMGLVNKKMAWPKRSAIIFCVVGAILESLGLVLLALKVLTQLKPYLSVLVMGTTVTFSVLGATFMAFKETEKVVWKIGTVVASLMILVADVAVFRLIIKDGFELDHLHVLAAFLSLNIAWLPWMQRQMTQSNVVKEKTQKLNGVTVATDAFPPTTMTNSADSLYATSSDIESPGSSVHMPPHATQQAATVAQALARDKDPFKKATWKASIIFHFTKLIFTFLFGFLFFYVDTSVNVPLDEATHQAFLDAWDFQGIEWTPFATNLISSAACYILVFIATHTNMQRGCLFFPLIASLPLSMVILTVQDLCSSMIGDLCTYDGRNDVYVIVIVALTVVAQTIALGRHTVRKEVIYLQKEGDLFWMPGYNGVNIDQWLLLNRRHTIRAGRVSLRAKPPRTRIYICTTMYREDEEEMKQLLESLAKINIAQANGNTFFESHVVFDGGVVGKKLSEFALVLISLLQETLGKDPSTCTKVITPYGLKLSWALPAAHGKSEMMFNIHLKDNMKVKNKKRWSQIMYMSFVLDFLSESAAPDEELYILTTDADVKFTPESVEALMDLMSRDNTIGAVCARTHPMGTGPLVWYQIFEYAVGHWFQKAAEHVLGSVLCAPGCFSVYRCTALRDILPKYCKKVETAFEFLTKDMGEDRWLCTLMVQSGWRIEYCAASENSTNCPSQFEEFYKQRRRWIASTLANLMLIIKEWQYIALFNHRVSVVFLLYQGLLLFSTLIGPSTVILIVSGGLSYAWGINTVLSVVLQLILCVILALICISTSSKTQMMTAKFYTFLYATVMCAVVVGTAEQIVSDISPPTQPAPAGNGTTTTMVPSQHISVDIPISITTIYFAFLVGIFFLAGLLHPREFTCLFHGIWYLLCLPSAYLVLMIYSICNLTDSSWGTREGVTESNVMKKQSWKDKYQELFKAIFFCCAPPPAKTYGVDEETQTLSNMRQGSVTSLAADVRPQSCVSDDGFARARPGSEFGELDGLSGDFSIAPESNMESEIEIAEQPIPVEDWLPTEFKAKYLDIFKRNGFDNTMFIKALNETEMNRMGITKRGHVQYLITQIAHLPAFEIEYKVPTNINDWLEEIGLIQYKDVFRRNHIRTPKQMEILKRFDMNDIEKELGIKKKGHIKRLLYAIRMLRDPSEVQQKAIKMSKTIDEAPIHYLRTLNPGEYDFWVSLREKCLEPDLKAFGIEAEIKDKLVELRNNWLIIMAVTNTLWLILITTLATKANLNLLGANPIGLVFLFVFGLLFIIQFLAMIVHRMSTMSHYLARASYKMGKPMQTSWSFRNTEQSYEHLEDSQDRHALRQVKRDEKRAIEKAKHGKHPQQHLRNGGYTERTPLMSASNV